MNIPRIAYNNIFYNLFLFLFFKHWLRHKPVFIYMHIKVYWIGHLPVFIKEGCWYTNVF
jgi:hypothetical protein